MSTKRQQLPEADSTDFPVGSSLGQDEKTDRRAASQSFREVL